MTKNSSQKQTIRLQMSHSAPRLDSAISENCPDVSRTLARKIIDAGGVHLSGRRMRQCGHRVKAGDKIEIYIDGLSLKYYRINSDDVIYQDQFIIVINKPSLVESQPTPARYKGTLYEALLLWLQNPASPHVKPSLGMVQRLDRDTSGVMIFSIHPRAHKSLTKLFAERRVKKRYLALISGNPQTPEGEFRSLLAKNRASNKMKSVDKGGKLAITSYKIIRTFENCSLVEVDIPTGRMHQIRVHFAEAGHPLIGDIRYGYQEQMLSVPVKRTMLHSWQLECLHPVTKKTHMFEAAIPADMCHLLNYLGCENVDISPY